MKKTIVFSFVFMFLLVGSVSAFEFDNSLKHENNKLIIRNAFGLGDDLVEYKLLENGCEFWDCKSTIEVTLHKKDRVFDNFDFKKRNNDMEELHYTIKLNDQDYNGEKLEVGTYIFEIRGRLNEGNDVDWGFSALGITEDNTREYWAWWEATLPYRTPVNIQVNAEAMSQFYTVEATGFDTSDTSKFNLSNSTNFAVTCDNTTEIDKIIGNETGILNGSTATSTYYGANTGWGTSSTTVLFRMPYNLSASTTYNELCYFYYGSDSFYSNYTNLSNIFLLGDNFDRADSATVGNGWADTGNAEIDGNMLNVTANNANIRRALDVGNLTNVAKWEMLFALNPSGTVGDQYYTSFTDVMLGDDATPTGGNGIYTVETYATTMSIVDANGAGTIKSSTNARWAAGTTTPIRIISIDRVNAGDFIVYQNETLLTFSTNGTNTDAQGGNKGYVKTIGQRTGDRMDYIFIKRYMETPATITMGGEENNIVSSVTLESPLNNSQLTTTSSNFTANFSVNSATMNWTNATYYVWNSSGEFNKTIITLPTINVTRYGLVINNFAPGQNYDWNIFGCYDNTTQTNCTFALANYTFYNTPFTERNYSFVNQTFETENQNFSIYINTNPNVNSVAGNFWYNGTRYSTLMSEIVSGQWVGEALIDIPLANSSSDNKTFFWEFIFTLTDTRVLSENSTIFSHTVNRTFLELCNVTYTVAYLNATTKNAINPFPDLNATFKVSWDHYMDTGTGSIVRPTSYEDVTETNSSYDFCMSPVDKGYVVDSQIEVDAIGYSPSNYYLENANFSNTSQAINIYLLNDSSSTITTIRVEDTAQRPLEDILVHIQLFDVGTGTFYTTAMAMTSFNGEDIVYLNWYDSFYKFLLYRGGNLIKTTNTTKIAETPFVITIEDNVTYDFDKFRDMTYSLYYNNNTENFVATFTKPSGSVEQGCLRVIRRNSTSDLLICETCETSTSATLYCNIGSYDNGTFLAAFYATGSWYLLDWIVETIGDSFAEEIYDLLGNEDATFYAILFGGIVTTLFMVSPVFAVIGILLGLLGSAALGFTNFDYFAFIGISLVGMIVMWVMKK